MSVYRWTLVAIITVIGCATMAEKSEACTDSLIRIDLASIHYETSYIVARFPAQLFSMDESYRRGYSVGLRTLSDSLATMIARSTKLDTADYRLDYPDARLSVLLTNDSGVVTLIAFGGHKMFYKGQLYRLNPDIIELLYPFLPESHVVSISNFLKLARYRDK